MNFADWKRPLLLFITVLSFVCLTLIIATITQNDKGNRVRFDLTNQDGKRVTQNHFSGKHQLVFFGFTSCEAICPTQMHKLSRVMRQLDETNSAQAIRPIFISVDPERDTVQAVSQYLENFDDRFVGLTGSRSAIRDTTNAFKTFLEEPKLSEHDNYQITHSTVVYVVDPFSRIIDSISFEADVDTMVETLKKHII